MFTFKRFLEEQRVIFKDRQHLADTVDEYLKAGEILNPEYAHLKQQADSLYHKTFYPHENRMLEITRTHQDDDLWELHHALAGWNLSSIVKAEKLIPKVEKKKLPGTEEYLKFAKQYVKDWKPIFDGIKSLKDKAVKVTTKRAEAKATAAKSMEKKFKDSSNLIKILESHLDEYKEMAETRAKEFVKSKLDELKKHGWDLDKAAPVPKLRDVGNEAWQIAKQKQQTLVMLTTAESYSKTNIRVKNPAAINKYIKDAVDGAEQSYRAFMQKMIEKIGKPVVKAKMTGSIWTDATLTVTTDDGETQVWSTRMILNFSKYQRMFNQFPSRRKK